MSLFQTQVERQFLGGITTDLTPIYKKFVDYFGSPAIQANILELIEQQYQGEFIEALFVNILGYTAQPQPNFNLLREKKNETDAKSADAAISINNQITAVIELKDHKTQDLKKVEVQAFGYKNNHKNCHYVVTSNFERLRFYIDNAVDFIEFDLFNLTFDEFRRLWLCLSYESMAKNLPQEIKNQSLSTEDVITKKLYKDYSVFKRLLFDNIVTLNPENDKLLLFKETQKLLDRFLFLFFAEDKSLLPANSIQGTVDKWTKFNADPMNDYQSLYSRFVKYFKLLDVGYKDANTEIYAYNGGLFANDEFLNKLRIDDTILAENVLKLAQYDYDTDVDVNILGHIFENSLNEIEAVSNEINTGVKATSKRKQDGVFYTPRYITQYIVENTVGRLCEEKKTELGIGEELFEYKRTDKKKQALKVFDTYREWLLQITIVDPACGSGAFLNTALDFLIAEHNWIDNQQDKIAGSKDHFSMGLSNIENTILENNLFGVDINEESVEIAKLSLWLRTAKPHRKLSSLNNNIKCGNSLIDDPAVAGEKAFDWEKEFPQVFGREQKAVEVTPLEKDKTPDYLKLIKEKSAEAQLKAEQGIALSQEALEITKQVVEYANKLDAVSAPKPKYEKLKGGFDVVIGNPPYVRNEYISSIHKVYFEKNYKTFSGKADLYVFFFEKALGLLKTYGKTGFIVSSKYTKTKYGKILIDFLHTNSEIKGFIDFKDLDVFQGIIAYPSIILFNKQKVNPETNYSQLLVVSNENYTEIDNKFSNSNPLCD
jgi:type I restriction-modification system DNA methylase subunit